MSVRPPARLPVHLYVRLSVCMTFCLSVRPSVQGFCIKSNLFIRNTFTYQCQFKLISNQRIIIQLCTIIYYCSIRTIGGDTNLQGYKTFGMLKVAFHSSAYLILFASISYFLFILIPIRCKISIYK